MSGRAGREEGGGGGGNLRDNVRRTEMGDHFIRGCSLPTLFHRDFIAAINIAWAHLSEDNAEPPTTSTGAGGGEGGGEPSPSH